MLINFRNALMTGKPKDPLAVIGSVYGSGASKCIFTKAFSSPVPSIHTDGFTSTCWAKFPTGTRGHFFTVGCNDNGFSLGHGANGDSGANGNYINGLANIRWWLPTNNTITDERWHHYAIIANTPFRGPSYIFVDGSLFGQISLGANAANNLTSSSHITLLGVCDGTESRYLTGYATRLCVYFEAKDSSFIASDFARGLNAPDTTGLAHYYNGAEENGELKDMVGDMNLTPWNGATFSTEIPS